MTPVSLQAFLHEYRIAQMYRGFLLIILQYYCHLLILVGVLKQMQ